MDFVSEKEITSSRENGNIDESIDSRPLFERLKEVRDKKQMEIDESRKLKNQFRGLDNEETEFLDMVDKVKAEQELKKKKDEEEILRECRKATTGTALVPSLDDIKPSVSDVPAKRHSKQATLLSAAIRKRTHSNEQSTQEPVNKKLNQEPAQPIGKQSTSMKLIGILPGINYYSASSDDEDNSDSSDSNDELILPSLQSNATDKDKDNNINTPTSHKSMSAKNNSNSTAQT